MKPQRCGGFCEALRSSRGFALILLRRDRQQWVALRPWRTAKTDPMQRVRTRDRGAHYRGGAVGEICNSGTRGPRVILHRANGLAEKASVLLRKKPLAALAELLLDRGIDRGEAQVELLDPPDDRRGHDKLREPLAVGGHDVPRRVRRRRVPDRVLVGLHVVVPVTALPDVARRELPILLGLVEALEEALLLLVAGYVEEELQDEVAVPRKVAFEARDVLVALFPDALGQQFGRQLPFLSTLGPLDMKCRNSQWLLAETGFEDLVVVPSVIQS